MDKKLQIKLIDWVINVATEEQLEGMELLVARNNDIVYGLELVVGPKEYKQFIISENNKE